MGTPYPFVKRLRRALLVVMVVPITAIIISRGTNIDLALKQERDAEVME